MVVFYENQINDKKLKSILVDDDTNDSEMDLCTSQTFNDTSKMFNKFEFNKDTTKLCFSPQEHRKYLRVSYDPQPINYKYPTEYNGNIIPPTINTLSVSNLHYLDCFYDLPTTINTIQVEHNWQDFDMSRYQHINDYHFMYGSCFNRSTLHVNTTVFNDVNKFNSYVNSPIYSICGKLPYNTLLTLYDYRIKNEK